jgi:hypothetical protein
MGLVAEQNEFTLDMVKLIDYAFQQGFTVTLGEAYRTKEQQDIYIAQKKSKTANSMHLKRLALDLNFFKNGELIESNKELYEIGKYWESLDEKNRWGGSWRGLIESGQSTFDDYPHFERYIP